MVITLQDYKEIRQRYMLGESQRNIAKALQISRNTVAKYCEGATVPWERKPPERKATVLDKEVVAFIQKCLKEDEVERIRKQRHTAKRIYDRLVAERGFIGGESTVRAKVRELKDVLPKAFVPLVFSPGEALQVDWGEVIAYINGVKQKVNLFCARLCSSCAPVVVACRRQNEESFQEAFVRTFEQIGGVPEKVIFDNGRVAVSDQGSHFTDQAYLDLMESNGVRISMDGKGQALDNVRTERFFRSLKYEDIYINEYITPREMIAGVNRYILDYNTIRPHESLGGLAPDAFVRQQKTHAA